MSTTQATVTSTQVAVRYRRNVGSLSTDMSTDTRPIYQSRCVGQHSVRQIGRHIGRYVCRHVDRHISIDTSAESRSIQRPTYRSSIGRCVDRYVGRDVGRHIGRGVRKLHMIRFHCLENSATITISVLSKDRARRREDGIGRYTRMKL